MMSVLARGLTEPEDEIIMLLSSLSAIPTRKLMC